MEINLPESWWTGIVGFVFGLLGIRGVQVATRKGTEDALIREIRGLRSDLRENTSKVGAGMRDIHRRLDDALRLRQ